jgi:hypothetical protein
MRPGERRQLSVRASPAGEYLVRFALLGDVRDASLDRSEAYTSDNGEAELELTAPTGAGAVTTFTVRASAATAVTAQIAVSVSEGGFATLEVVPSYAGSRSVSSWVASVRPGTDCAALPELPAPDADLTARSAAEDEAPVITAVPVGRVLAVTLRADYFAGGCTEVSELAADQRTQVVVLVTDVPLKLEQTSLEVGLGVDNVTPSWQEVLEPLVSQATEALLGDSDDDVDALLDAMHESAARDDAADAFAAARSAASWDELVATAWDPSLAATAIREVAADWMSSAAGELDPRTIEGRLVSAGDMPGRARLSLDSFCGVDAQSAGFVVSNLVSWNADPDDTVLLGATLFWLPSQWLAHVALSAAGADVEAPASVPAALASILDCPGLGTELAESVDAAGEAFDTCDSSCLQAHCETAFDSLWTRVAEASAAAPATLQLSAAGAAKVDEAARPVAFDGSWLGTLDAGSPASLGGPAWGTMRAMPQ